MSDQQEKYSSSSGPDPFADREAVSAAKARSDDRRKVNQSHAQRKAGKKKRASAVKKPPVSTRGKLRPGHRAFIENLIKDPTNQTSAYKAVYPAANNKTAYRRSHELLSRPDVASELARLQKISADKAAMTRAKAVNALAGFFTHDFRKFFEPALLPDGETPNPKAGEPKRICDLDEESARVMESYERTSGKYGDKVKFRTPSRVSSAELMAKLQGWTADDGRPPITANFHFNLGGAGSPQRAPVTVDAVPGDLYATMGLRDGNAPAAPMPTSDDDAPSMMPPGYEAGRGVRISNPAAELAADLDAAEDAKDGEKP